jgi:cysteine-rich repeat protein
MRPTVRTWSVRWQMRHGGPWSLLALTLVLGAGTVRADPVATGSSNSSLTSEFTYAGTDTFDDQTFTVFGTPVDLATTVGSISLSGSFTLVDTSGTTVFHAQASDPTVLQFDGSGDFICDPSGCGSGAPFFFVTMISNLSGTAVSGLPPGLTYTYDGQAIDTDPMTGTFSGTFAINAYQPSATPASSPGCSGTACAVTTTTSGTFAAPSGAQVPIPLDITFADVATAGTTTVVGLSNVAAAPPSNVVLDAPGFSPIFFDVSTTATVTPPITVCFHYADADDDGIVDGTTVPVTALRLLHRSSPTGAFVDETVLPVDTADQQVCAQTTGLSPFAVGIQAGCGNGLVEAGEQCDDAAANGTPGDCCTATCTLMICGICDACQPSLGCVSAPQPSCKTPTLPAAAQLQTKNVAPGVKDLLKWKWSKGQATTLADFGNPMTTDGYALCVYDESGPAPATLLGAPIPAGGACGSKPCWKATGNGFKYADKSGAVAGLTGITLKSGVQGRASVQVKGKGANLPFGSLPQTLPVPLTVQLRRDGKCWAATFSAAKSNVDGLFKGRSD